MRRPTPRTMLYEMVGTTLVEVHTSRAPTEAEWDSFLAGCFGFVQGATGCVVVSDGGGPTMKQRRRMRTVPGPGGKPTAVVLSTPFARAVMNALAWLGQWRMSVKAFAPEDLDDAFTYAQVPYEARARVTASIAKFKVDLAGESLAQLVPASLSASETDWLIDRVARDRIGHVRSRIDAMKNKRGPRSAASGTAALR